MGHLKCPEIVRLCVCVCVCVCVLRVDFFSFGERIQIQNFYQILKVIITPKGVRTTYCQVLGKLFD